MRVFLVQQGLANAIKSTLANMTDEQKSKWQEIQERAHSEIVLCLSYKFLREASHEKTTIEVWNKFQELHQ